MTAGDAIHVTGKIESKLRHVEPLGPGQVPQLVKCHRARQQDLEQFIGEAVVAGLYRRMRCEHASLADFAEFVLQFTRPYVLLWHMIAIEQLKGEKCSMPLVEVVSVQVEAE